MTPPERKPWLTPKFDSFESFACFVAAMLAVATLIYLAITERATPLAVGSLMAIFAAVARRWLR